MKTRIFLVAAAVLLFSCGAFAQGFIASLYSGHADYSPAPLYVNCDGTGGGIPDGWNVTIWWDANNNGPDASDVQPPVGQNVGELNFNNFQFNSGMGVPGTFATDPALVSMGAMPANPHYYLKVACASGTTEYVSAVFTCVVGPQDVLIDTWTCTPCQNLCTATPMVLFYVHPVPYYFCANLCAGVQTLLRVCPDPGTPALDPTKTPIVTVTAGCDPGNTGCNMQCTPGQFVYNSAGWVYDPATGCFVNVITGVTDNTCVCVALTGFLAAGIDNFTGTAGSNEVTLGWVSHNDANTVSYSLIRNGHALTSVPVANNSPAGNTYNYVDHTALNGTTYTYGLRINNSDGSTTDYGTTVTSTPSLSHAVVTEYALLQNYPNPFNPTTEIAFDVLNSNPVTLKVYNANGQVVATLVNGVTYPAASHNTVNFDAANLPSGIYFYTVKIGSDFSATKKMLLVK